MAGVIPPYQVVADVCSIGKVNGLGSITWAPYRPDESEYLSACKYLENRFGYTSAEAPGSVCDFFKWSIWQYSFSHGVPYEEHLALAEKERYCEEVLLKSEGLSDDELMGIHLEKVAASNAVDELLASFMRRDR